MKGTPGSRMQKHTHGSRLVSRSLALCLSVCLSVSLSCAHANDMTGRSTYVGQLMDGVQG